ncbi:MAG: FAD:protein FMN transferase [Saprospirales bacterium]|nr:MAG: FAD:protein FMN transferase [Saprospirales bacterium]
MPEIKKERISLKSPKMINRISFKSPGLFLGLIFILSGIIFFQACSEGAEEPAFFQLTGPTMGTSYSIVFEGMEEKPEIHTSVDSLLEVVNQELSTWIPESTISRFNQSETGILLDADLPPYFLDNIQISDNCVQWTDGWFDPTVMPLVNYWGFGFAGREAPEQLDSNKVDSLLNYVGWKKIFIEERDEGVFVGKENSGVQLDFSAVAKGYGVDVLADFFEKKGISNYLIDIGGEVCVNGKGRHGNGWVLGVNSPDPTAPASEITMRFTLQSGCVATSGNYRNFREVEGQIIGHTLNPRTGFPEINRLLSVTIWYEDSAHADALATGALGMGFPAAMNMVENIDGAEAFFIFINEEGETEKTWTAGFEPFLN